MSDPFHESFLAEGRAFLTRLGFPDHSLERSAEGFALGIYWRLADKGWELLMEKGPEVLGRPNGRQHDALRMVEDWERYDRMLARLPEARSWDELLVTP